MSDILIDCGLCACSMAGNCLDKFAVMILSILAFTILIMFFAGVIEFLTKLIEFFRVVRFGKTSKTEKQPSKETDKKTNL